MAARWAVESAASIDMLGRTCRSDSMVSIPSPAAITLPGARYGLISAAMVVFTMAVSEFGVPKVIE